MKTTVPDRRSCSSMAGDEGNEVKGALNLRYLLRCLLHRFDTFHNMFE
jgi:hypothetical protein